MPYQKPWGTGHPGLLIVLVDQSASMQQAFGGTGGGTKANAVAQAVNRVLDEFVAMCAQGAGYNERAHFAVLGYGGRGVEPALAGELANRPWVTPSDLDAEPLRIEQPAPGEDAVERMIWVDPVAQGGTPMSAAFDRAREIADAWVAAGHASSYPPVVINITDGEPTDGTPKGDPTAAARRLMEISTDDGTLLLYNCHIAERGGQPLEFPSDPALVPPDVYAQRLFAISSAIPDSAKPGFLAQTQRVLESGTRGYIFNGDAGSVHRLLTFGTIAAPSDDQ
ncbi:MAG: VWA domain-containing protein [Chloroflexi bacterium]|nr:VWA domain-containing protein [Chloroflexota bacterium]